MWRRDAERVAFTCNGKAIILHGREIKGGEKTAVSNTERRKTC